MNKLLVEVGKILEEVGSKVKITAEEQFEPIKYGPDSIELNQPLKIDVEVESTSLGELLVKGVVNGKVQLQCSRCLKFFNFPLELELEEVFFRSPHSEEAFKIVGNKIDLGPSIEETMLLTLPMKPLCGDGCRGLCPICGQNLNEGSCECPQEVVDKRLAKLKDWFKDKKQKE